VRRVFYVALGATAGVLVVRKVQKAARSYTPAGLGDRAGGSLAALRRFADEVSAGMATRETELRDALGLDDARGDLPPAAAAELIEHPTRHRRSTG
jgi:hypothetical protein